MAQSISNWDKKSGEPIHRITNYSTDLSEQDWLAIHQLLPRDMLTSKNRKVNLRNVVDAIAYWVENDASLLKEIPVRISYASWDSALLLFSFRS